MSTLQHTDADSLLREAEARTYRFPPDFAGFEARLEWTDSDGSGEAGVAARPGAEHPVVLEGAAPGWVERELRSIVGHRTATPYDQGDGARPKRIAVEQGGVSGTTVELDDELDSSYVVDDGLISLVTRSMHGARFTIVVQTRTPAHGGTFLPSAFSVVYRDEDGRLSSAEAYTDEYVSLDGVLVPSSRTVVRADENGITARRLFLTEHVTRARGEES